MTRSRALYEPDREVREAGPGKWELYIGERLLGWITYDERTGKYSAEPNIRSRIYQREPHRGFIDIGAAALFLERRFDR